MSYKKMPDLSAYFKNKDGGSYGVGVEKGSKNRSIDNSYAEFEKWCDSIDIGSEKTKEPMKSPDPRERE